MNSDKISKLDIASIVQVRLPETQYYPETHPKKQIVLHHTVSGPSAKNVMAGWAKTPARIGTAFIIDGIGIIHQCFSSSHWAHHLGTKHKNNTTLNQQSIGIEICSWGGLIKKGYKFYSTTGTEIPIDEVIDYGNDWRGFRYFQKYKPEQLESLKLLVLYLCERYNIPPNFNMDIWEINQKALVGMRGIYTHVSYRKDKSDCHPEPSLSLLLEIKKPQI